MRRRRSCPPIATGSGSFAGFRFDVRIFVSAAFEETLARG